MADTFTTNLVLTLAEVGSSESTWGTKLNSNFSAIDALFQNGPALKIVSGGTGAVTAAEARTNLGLGTLATQNASAVAITGGTATVGSATISSTLPILIMTDTDSGTNEKSYQFRVDAGRLFLYALNDGGAVVAQVMGTTRVGETVTRFDVFTALYENSYRVYTTNTIGTAPIAEAQITDGTTFPRLASTETVTGQWNFTTIPQKTSGGKFLHYASSSYVGGAVTVSTEAPSGTPATGDRWVRYVP